MLSPLKYYQEAIDDDAFPWHRFPNYVENEKTLSYLTINGEEPNDPTVAERPFGEYLFRGEYGTNFQPPGLERNVRWNFLHAKRPPPGIPFPTNVPLPYSTPMSFTRSTGYAMKTPPSRLPWPAHSVTDRNRIDSEISELDLTTNDGQGVSRYDSPPSTAILCGRKEPVETAVGLSMARVDQERSSPGSLIQDSEVLEAEEIASGARVASPSDWPQRRQSSLLQESSNESSVLSNPSNTPERLVSNKTSNTSLKSGFHDTQP